LLILASLLPFTFAIFQTVLTVAIGAISLLTGAGKERFVLLGVDLVLRVTAHTERINLWPGIHNIGRGTVPARGPGFISNVGITLAVAVRAADIGPCMDNGNILLHVVNMTNETATVIGYGSGRWDKLFLTIIKQQPGLIIRYGFPAGPGFCVCIRLLFSLHLLTACSGSDHCRQNKHQETVFHTFCPDISLSGEAPLISFREAPRFASKEAGGASKTVGLTLNANT